MKFKIFDPETETKTDNEHCLRGFYSEALQKQYCTHYNTWPECKKLICPILCKNKKRKADKSNG